MYIVIPCTTTYQFPLVGIHTFCNCTTNPNVNFGHTFVHIFHWWSVTHYLRVNFDFMCTIVVGQTIEATQECEWVNGK